MLRNKNKHLTKPICYHLDALFGQKKKGIWLTVEPNLSFKLATLTKEGEEYLNKYKMDIVFKEPQDEYEKGE